jgi:phosphonate transport system substrate-binding protein
MARTIGWVLCACLVWLSGCSREEPLQKVDLTRKEPVRVTKEEDVVTYAYLPQYSHTLSYQRHHPLVEYLRRQTGLNIKQIFPDTFGEHMNMTGRGEIDISYSNPLIYVKIAHRYGARAFARTLDVYGGENFRGQIICRADNPRIQSIADCRGKRWIAVDPSSAGGYLYPLGYFIEHGIRREDFSQIDFAPGPGGKQEKVVLAVYAGKYDVGSVREGTLDVVRDRIDINEIRVMASTRWYPGWVYAARTDLEQEVVQKIGNALCDLDYTKDSSRRILDAAELAGIIPSEDKDFDPVRELAGTVGIDLDE